MDNSITGTFVTSLFAGTGELAAKIDGEGLTTGFRRHCIQALGLNILFSPLSLVSLSLSLACSLILLSAAFMGKASLPLTPLKRVYYEVSVLARLLFE